jgi:hypothetical protein
MSHSCLNAQHGLQVKRDSRPKIYGGAVLSNTSKAHLPKWAPCESCTLARYLKRLPYASVTFITDGSGNVVGATVTVSGNSTHLGLFSGTGTIQFLPDANDPNISHPAGEVTYVAANGDRLPTVIEDRSMDLRTGIATGYMVFQSGTGRFERASGTQSSSNKTSSPAPTRSQWLETSITNSA